MMAIVSLPSHLSLSNMGLVAWAELPRTEMRLGPGLSTFKRFLRVQLLTIVVLIPLWLTFVYTAQSLRNILYSGADLNISIYHGSIVPSYRRFQKQDFDFKVIVTGQDADRGSETRRRRSLRSVVSDQGQKCRIPKLDMDAPELKKFFFKEKPLDCDKNPLNWLYLDDTNHVRYIESRRQTAKCLGFYVKRKTDHENELVFFNKLPDFSPMLSDFALVKCVDGFDTWIGKLVTVVRKSDKDLLAKNSKRNSDTTGLNVFILGFDSMSHMTFRRKMPKTVELLERKFDSVILNGYNIVGDGTPQAFIPILTAATEEELPLTRHRFPNAHYVDDVYPFIWSNFSAAGYVTLYGEDSYGLGTFTYRLKGFRNQPTDHYTRTIFLEHEKTGGMCFGSEPIHRAWFRYARKFMQVYKDKPRFLLMHQGLLSHGNINRIEAEDEDLANILMAMLESGELDDTVVILMADHGHRFSVLRQTHQGQLEERLPFFSISLPAKFINTIYGRKMYTNLLDNKDRLSTPFDIHATLMDILHLPKDLTTMQDASKRSLSLFRPIPEDRTCAQAGIDPHWCTCLNWEDAMGTDEDKALSQKLSLAIVDVINKQLKDVFHLCAKLSLKEVLESKKLVPNEGVMKYKDVKDKDGFVPDMSGNAKTAFAHYQVKLRTTPGEAIYEVTLFYDFIQKEVHIDMNSFSHPNKFGDAPHCIIDDNYYLATFCVCHDKV
ncbi:hypothetical protein Y032_0314g2247 [Ancylostoma ceylanicum]|uniref:Uncharacterized protein n=1 Tax=Ancylostoma ceylanicum TaxID=53326 RepID=A0A016S1S6_9BILA|nr:hypothetical protein Y032_0314g2247 [Ancylostoma ceylanicum]